MLGDDHELIEIGLPDFVKIVAELLRSGIQVSKVLPFLLASGLIIVFRRCIYTNSGVLVYSFPSQYDRPVVS